MTYDYDTWSLAKLRGYNEYYAGSEDDGNPYDYHQDNWQWNQWCDGNMEAYCENEGK